MGQIFTVQIRKLIKLFGIDLKEHVIFSPVNIIYLLWCSKRFSFMAPDWPALPTQNLLLIKLQFNSS